MDVVVDENEDTLEEGTGGKLDIDFGKRGARCSTTGTQREREREMRKVSNNKSIAESKGMILPPVTPVKLAKGKPFMI